MKPIKKPLFFETFISELLQEDQYLFFCHWLAVGLRSLANNDFTPGQACVLAGERRCGKSLLQNMVTEIFGGRAGNPFPYMSGETNFNRDFCGSEHWLIEDPRGSKAMQDRIDFGARLKEATVNRDYTIHQKQKDAIYLPLFRRVTISVNLELEYLSVLPPFDHSIMDKISLFLCSKVVNAFEPLRERSGELIREKIWQPFMVEVPAARLWLLKNFTAPSIPKDLRDDRFIIAAWHHPELLSALSSLSHENRLLELIDDLYFSGEGPFKPEERKANELQKELMEKNSFEASKLLRYAGACGSHLGKLSKSHPERISKRVVTGIAIWTIKPPVMEKK